jgi:hypothetical protein
MVAQRSGSRNQEYDLAVVEHCWRRHGRVESGGVEQGDEADEGPLEKGHTIIVGALRGSVVINIDLRRSGPSQLIPGVLRTFRSAGEANARRGA